MSEYNMNMTYESFIRGAFSIDKENMINRWGDPAGIANTDEFEAGGINTVKSGVAYSIVIYKNHIFENNKITDAEYNDMDRILADVINAHDKKAIYNLIEEFNDKYAKKYIRYKWNK